MTDELETKNPESNVEPIRPKKNPGRPRKDEPNTDVLGIPMSSKMKERYFYVSEKLRERGIRISDSAREALNEMMERWIEKINSEPSKSA